MHTAFITFQFNMHTYSTDRQLLLRFGGFRLSGWPRPPGLCCRFVSATKRAGEIAAAIMGRTCGAPGAYRAGGRTG